MKEIIKKLLFKLGLKKYQWKFITRYIIQTKNKILYSNNKRAEKYIEKEFKEALGYEINFKEKMGGGTFNQKIQYRKLYPQNELYSNCTDKYLVREYVKGKIGEKYLTKLYLVTDKLTKEQWEKLPNSFVIKANHDSGTVKIIRDKSEITNPMEIIKEMNLSLKINFGWYKLEKHYIPIKPRLIVEELLTNENGEILKDYKFHIFKDKIIIQVDADRFIEHKRNFYDENMNRLNFQITSSFKNFDEEIKINDLDEMKNIAKKLASDFDYVRVDLYEIEGRIYFGELTFTHGGGLEDIKPLEWDYKLGEYWK